MVCRASGSSGSDWRRNVSVRSDRRPAWAFRARPGRDGAPADQHRGLERVEAGDDLIERQADGEEMPWVAPDEKVLLNAAESASDSRRPRRR